MKTPLFFNGLRTSRNIATQVKGGVSEGDFKFKLVTVGDSGVGKLCLRVVLVSRGEQ